MISSLLNCPCMILDFIDVTKFKLSFTTCWYYLGQQQFKLVRSAQRQYRVGINIGRFVVFRLYLPRSTCWNCYRNERKSLFLKWKSFFFFSIKEKLVFLSRHNISWDEATLPCWFRWNMIPFCMDFSCRKLKCYSSINIPVQRLYPKSVGKAPPANTMQRRTSTA